MAEVVFDEVTKVYSDGTKAVDSLALDIADGEFMVLVGPSGCGKTTALRMVAGLEDISGGVVRIGDRIVNHVPSRDRDIAMVFQSYALYPHLSVYENIAFGLRLKKVPKKEIDQRVQEAARVLGLDPFDIIRSIRELFQAIWDMGYEAFERLWRYFLLGTVLVVPIWLIVRLVRAPRGR